MSRLYESEQEIDQVVRGFETCATAKTDFHHREHLTVTVWYLQTLSREQALDAMRSGLQRFIKHHGVDPKKYSEEITVFWVDTVASYLEGMRSEAPLVEKCNEVIGAFVSATARIPEVSSTVRTPASRVAGEVSPAKS